MIGKPRTPMTKRQSYFWFAIFAFGSIAFTLVQDNIRPNYRGQSEIIKYLLGIAPNYFAGLGLSSFFVVMITHINSTSKKPSTSVWLTNKAQITSLSVSVIGLSLWEFMQTFSARGKFDWHDLLWTVIGGLTFYFIWLVILNDLGLSRIRQKLIRARTRTKSIEDENTY